MFDYLVAFEISATGMEAQQARLNAVALNLANTNTTRTVDGGPYKPLSVSFSENVADQRFESLLNQSLNISFQGVQAHVHADNRPPRLVHEPAHPDADLNGYVAYPNIDLVSEMVQMMEATHMYEANIRSLNAAKTMALQALEIGGR